MRTNDSAVDSSMEELPDPRDNHVLAYLFERDRQRWEPHLEPFEVTMGDVLYDEHNHSEYLYFPITASVSLIYTLNDGASTEIAAIGNQGVAGIGLLVGGAITPSRAVVRNGGTCYRLKAQVMRGELNHCGPSLDVILRCTQALIAQMAHNIGRLLPAA
jgi:hypothetical protein